MPMRLCGSPCETEMRVFHATLATKSQHLWQCEENASCAAAHWRLSFVTVKASDSVILSE